MCIRDRHDALTTGGGKVNHPSEIGLGQLPRCRCHVRHVGIVHHTFCPASSAKGSRRLEEMAARCPVSRTMTEPMEGNPRRPQADPPTKVSLLEVAVWFPTSEIMVLSQQVLQVGTRVSPKWGSYRGESNSI